MCLAVAPAGHGISHRGHWGAMVVRAEEAGPAAEVLGHLLMPSLAVPTLAASHGHALAARDHRLEVAARVRGHHGAHLARARCPWPTVIGALHAGHVHVLSGVHLTLTLCPTAYLSGCALGATVALVLSNVAALAVAGITVFPCIGSHRAIVHVWPAEPSIRTLIQMIIGTAARSTRGVVAWSIGGGVCAIACLWHGFAINGGIGATIGLRRRSRRVVLGRLKCSRREHQGQELNGH